MKLTGTNLRTARSRFIALGGTVTYARRTGEEKFSHPALERSVKVNARRKDAGRELTQMIHRIERARP